MNYRAVSADALVQLCIGLVSLNNNVKLYNKMWIWLEKIYVMWCFFKYNNFTTLLLDQTIGARLWF